MKRRKARRRWWRWPVLAVLAAAVLAAVGLGALWVATPDLSWMTKKNPDTTAFIELRAQEAASAKKKFRLRWTWVPLNRISPLLRTAVVHAEDARFFQHEGIDWEAVRETAERDWRERSLSRGGSTITQQVAKNLFLSPSRNPIRKLRELFIAWELEDELPKERILEIYLNIAEWGPGVFGAEAAARYWFNRSAESLDAVQAARLAVALPNPRTRSPKARSRTLDRKAARLVRALHRGGLIDAGARAAARSQLGQPSGEVAPPPTVDEQKEPTTPLPDDDGPGPPDP